MSVVCFADRALCQDTRHRWQIFNSPEREPS
jgi:hypothetical protein